MSSVIIQGNALALPLADDSVDLVVTSPPYFGLRSYQDGGEHYAGQIGSEATPTEFVDALIAATAEMVRVLKPSGSIFLNLGDKYATYAGNRSKGRSSLQGSTDRCRPIVPRAHGLDGGGEVRAKSLMLIPERYRIRCVDELDLIARAVIIWSKPNGLPESVTDRVRRSHEDWVHLTLRPRYYSAVDEIREEYTWGPAHAQDRSHPSFANRRPQDPVTDAWQGNPLGKLPGSVWSIPTQPLTIPAELGVDHFAAFPMEWPRRIIQGWSPREVCTACGEGRRPVVLRERAVGMDVSGGIWAKAGKHSNITGRQHGEHSVHQVTGYACACTPSTSNYGKRGDWRDGREVMPDHLSDDWKGRGGATPRRPGGFGAKVLPPETPKVEYHLDGWEPPPTTPGVVLDPFGGTGTTALLADTLGRHGISVDMSADYCRIATWRTTDPGERARALEVDKPAAQVPGQWSLFDTVTA